MCWKCGKNIEQDFIGRNDECPFCGSDLHSCKNCSFFDKNVHWECRENTEEFVAEKEKRNFCASFSVKRTFSCNTAEKNSAEQAKIAFKNLFGN